jgi:hypothetical protein
MASDIKNKTVQTPKEEEVVREYFFPAHGKTVTATSPADAQSKLTALLEKPNN